MDFIDFIDRTKCQGEGILNVKGWATSRDSRTSIKLLLRTIALEDQKDEKSAVLQWKPICKILAAKCPRVRVSWWVMDAAHPALITPSLVPCSH